MVNKRKAKDLPKKPRGGSKPKASVLPLCSSISAAVAMTGIPPAVWSTAKREGSPGFDRMGRIEPRAVLEWWFTKRSDEAANTDWKGRKLKAQALKAELDLEVARGEVIPEEQVRHQVTAGMSACFAVWDRETSLLPPKAKGLDEPAIKALMIETGESVKRAMRVALESLTEEKP